MKVPGRQLLRLLRDKIRQPAANHALVLPLLVRLTRPQERQQAKRRARNIVFLIGLGVLGAGTLRDAMKAVGGPMTVRRLVPGQPFQALLDGLFRFRVSATLAEQQDSALGIA